jgi:alkanesulfonate monooxygenase SsuD/methylene tetrahydromethanopterin reductase-like flavin-dependent oxidoreductase (luciferase family)
MTVDLDMGLHTFGDATADVDGALLPHAVVIRNLIDQAALADELGVDFIGVGEHHRADFARTRDRAAGDRITHETNPARFRHHRLEFGRSHSRL